MAAEADHVSAYALTAEAGTRLAARVRRGELGAPDDDVLADRYLAAARRFSPRQARLVRDLQLGGFRAAEVAHNMLYWTGGDWWGIGPGAHSHVGGTRWWNVRHPAACSA